MRRFPIDRQSIFNSTHFQSSYSNYNKFGIFEPVRCMSDLGRRHATFVQLLSDELLELHPVFDITEPAEDARKIVVLRIMSQINFEKCILITYLIAWELNNSEYFSAFHVNDFWKFSSIKRIENEDLAKLILILNAASAHDPVCSLLPPFVVRHYKFLRCSMPLLVPTIEAFSDDNASSANNLSINKKLTEAGERTRALLEHTYEMMQEASQSRSYQQRMTEKKLLLKYCF
ncbi:unnamed protein product [Onchocerca flexuosa]|uniref:Cyclin_C domain-containing protein n=1 Tax=Onchocerca flexuosa TaxID=387005 RepID=A0A183HLQ0_9BILA|nr:unnamed protein product [Onchocerca flexuosa]